MNYKFIGIIPARKGSKGIPNKNLKEINGKSLVELAIESAIGSKKINKIVISSDSEEILNVSKKYNNIDSLMRPDFLSSDEANTQDVVNHVLEHYNKSNITFDYIVLLQPTSPLRTGDHIKEAIYKLSKEDTEGVISVCEHDNTLLKCFLEDTNGNMVGVHNNDFPFSRRQDLPKTYHSNGAIYIINTKLFLKNKSFLTEKTKMYKMEEIDSVDIDNVSDLQIAENNMKKVNHD